MPKPDRVQIKRIPGAPAHSAWKPTFFDKNGKQVDVYINFAAEDSAELKRKIKDFYPGIKIQERLTNQGDVLLRTVLQEALPSSTGAQRIKTDLSKLLPDSNVWVDFHFGTNWVAVEKPGDEPGHGTDNILIEPLGDVCVVHYGTLQKQMPTAQVASWVAILARKRWR